MTNILKRSLQLKVKASISLLLAISIFWTSSIAIYTYRSAFMRNELLQLERLVDLYASQTLSKYNRDLLSRYGLWGFEEKEQSTLISKFNKENLLTNNEVEILSKLEGDILYSDILKFTNTRIHRSYFERIQGLIKSFRESTVSTREIKLEDILERLQQAIKLFPRDPIDFDEKFPHKPGKAARNLYLNLSSEEDELSTEDFSLWMNFLDLLNSLKTFEFKLPFSDESIGFDMGNDPLQSIIELIQKGSINIGDITKPIVDDMHFNEYVLFQYQSLTRGKHAKSDDGKNFITLTGKKLREQKHYSAIEAEKILLGSKHNTEALIKVIQFQLSNRVFMNYLAEITNESKMNTHKLNAEIVSKIILLVSLGSVQIDGEIIAYALALVPAFIEAAKDLHQLFDGDQVALFPNSSSVFYKVKVDYIDYLRLQALFTPKKIKLNTLEYFMGQNLKGQFFKGFVARIYIKEGRMYEKNFSYQ